MQPHQISILAPSKSDPRQPATVRALGYLTAEQSASNNGRSVVIIKGRAHAPADLEARWPGYYLLGTVAALVAAHDAGYQIPYDT